MSNQFSALQKSFLKDEILRSTLVPSGRLHTNIMLRFRDGKIWEVVNYNALYDSFLFGINYETEEEAIEAYNLKISAYRAAATAAKGRKNGQR